MSDLKKIPEFKSPEEEVQFWDEHDSADYVGWSEAQEVITDTLAEDNK